MVEKLQPFEKPSKSQLKREATALQDLGKRLVDLTAKQLRAIVLPEEILEAVKAAQKMPSCGARLRQIKYLGGLMREIDAETEQTIKQFFEKVGR
jgi:ribosome-associated protein